MYQGHSVLQIRSLTHVGPTSRADSEEKESAAEHPVPQYCLSLVGVLDTLSGAWILKWVTTVLGWFCGQCFLPAAFSKL